MIRRSVAIVCLLALALPLQHHLAEAGDATEEKKHERDTDHDQLDKLAESPPPGVVYNCMMTKQLRYYANCGCTSAPSGGYGISSSDQSILLDFIASLESNLNACGCAVTDMKVVEIAVLIEQFLDANPSISNALSYMTLNDSSGNFWGTPRDFCKLKDNIVFETVKPAITLDLNDNCKLFDGIAAAAQSSGDQEIIAECANFTTVCRGMLKESGYNVSEQLSFIYQILVSQCSVTTINFLKSSCSISGIGSFIAMFDVCQVNWRVQQMHGYMAGSSSSDNDLLMDLKATQDATCGASSTNYTVCGTLNSLIAQLTSVFSSYPDTDSRMEQCSHWIYQYCLGAPWICNIDLGSCGCKLNDIVACSAFCHNEDCCDWNGPPPSCPCSGETSGSESAGSGSGSGASGGSGSDETATPNASGSGASGGSGSDETATPNASGSGASGNSNSDSGSGASGGSGSGETATPNASGSGDSGGSNSDETATPNASGSGASGNSNSDSGSGASGGSGSGETATPNASGSGASGNSNSDSGSGASGGSGSDETATPNASGSGASGNSNSDSGSGASGGSGSGETATPNASGSGASGNSNSDETATPNASGSGASGNSNSDSGSGASGGSGSGETATPNASGSGASGGSGSDETPTPAESASNSGEASTSAPSTAAPTTASSGSMCSQCESLITVDTSCSCSPFIVSITQVVATWTFSARMAIGPTVTQLKNIVNNSTATFADKMSAILYQIDNCQATVSVQFKAIEIDFLDSSHNPDKNNKWGLVSDFRACASAMG